MIEYNKPILIFYGNLLYQGVTLSVVDGRLRVAGNTDKLSPAYRDEIRRRMDHLIALLSPPVPDELRPYFGRLMTVDESLELLGVAEALDVDTRLTPVNGGWLMTMGDGSQRPSTRRAARRRERAAERRTV